MPKLVQQLFFNYVSLKGLILFNSLATTDVDMDPADTKICPNFPRKKATNTQKVKNREG
jgi:hypothetical protein